MKYYFSLIVAFFVLYFTELFFARILPTFNFSFVLIFLLTAAFFAPTKTRYYFRSLIPISIICGLVADGMSALPTGVIFTTYLIISLLVVNIVKNLPQGEDLRILVIIIFCSVFLLRIALSSVFNYPSFLVVGKDIISAFFSAAFSSIVGLFIAFLAETKRGSGIVKILFSEE